LRQPALAQLMLAIKLGDRDPNSVEFFMGGQNITDQIRPKIPTTLDGWKEFRGD
jgi:hypothetical protein